MKHFFLARRDTLCYNGTMEDGKARKVRVSEEFLRVRLPLVLLDRLRDEATRQMTTKSEIVRQAIRHYTNQPGA